MVRFSIIEYVKNIIYNIISIILLAGTFVSCTIFTSNISAQTKMNRFFEPYLDKNSIITGYMGQGFDVEELGLIKLEKALCNQEIMTSCEEIGDLDTCLVYDEYVMENLTPKLKKGKIVTDGSGELMNILVSENNAGVAVGDIINFYFYVKEENVDVNKPASQIRVSAKVTGIIESGQKLFMGNGVSASSDMSLKDVIGTYHYEQLGESIVIIPEKELSKVPGKMFIENHRCIFKFQSDITSEERLDNYRKLIECETRYGFSSLAEIIPPMSDFVEMHEQETLDIIVTNIPICIAITILILVCIICMISIRNANNMRYYATLHICGMPIRNAFVLSGVEMGINSILAIIVSVSIIKIQMSNKIFGEINCVLNPEQWAIIIGISAVIVTSTMVSTLKTLKERSPMSVLRDTAY